MLELQTTPTFELIASGLVGLTMIGVVARNAFLGWYDARSKIKESEKAFPLSALPHVTTWDQAHVERFLNTFEEISNTLKSQVKFIEVISRSQELRSDQFQQSTQSRLDDIIDKLGVVEHKPPVRTRRKT